MGHDVRGGKIALEIEGFASLPRALGGLGVGILNAADDLAGGGAALTRGARQASRELKPVVIGENMQRVSRYARMIGAETIDDWLAGCEWSLELNAAWIRQIMREGREVIDIGPDFWARYHGTRQISRLLQRHAYALERYLLRQYSNYTKVFRRFNRTSGGVQGLQMPGLPPEPHIFP